MTILYCVVYLTLLFFAFVIGVMFERNREETNGD